MIDSTQFIRNKELQKLVDAWNKLSDCQEKKILKEKILQRIFEVEKDIFYTRYELRDFSTRFPISMLEDEIEEPGMKYHRPEYYEKILLDILLKNQRQLEPQEAIHKVFDAIKDKLYPADFLKGRNNIYRYITNIRFAAVNLKKKGLLRDDREVSHKFWALTLNIPRDITHAIICQNTVVAFGIQNIEQGIHSQDRIRLLVCDPLKPKGCNIKTVHYADRLKDFKPQVLLFNIYAEDFEDYDSYVAIKIYNLPLKLQKDSENFWQKHKYNFIRGFTLHDGHFAECVKMEEKIRKTYNLIDE